jgi:predicted transcriptional regulator YdeE
VLASAVTFTSCKNKGVIKPEKNAKEIIIPCKDEGRSDKNFFRADANATSQDMSLSREKALTAAKQRLAGLINTKIKSVTDRYVNETEVGTNSDFEQKFENLTREVVNQTLVDIAIVCEKNFQEETGKYTTYIAIEVDKETMLNGINNGITKDQKLRVDYDKMKFEQIFNEEMEKLNEESGN